MKESLFVWVAGAGASLGPLPVKVQLIMAYLLVALAVMMCFVLGLFSFKNDKKYIYANKKTYLLHRRILFAFSLFTVFFFLECPDGLDKLPLNDLGDKVLNLDGTLGRITRVLYFASWIFLKLFVVVLFVAVFGMASHDNDISGRGSYVNVLLLGMVLYAIALIVSIWVSRYFVYALWIATGTLVIQILLDAFFTIKNRSSFWSFISNSIWEAVCLTSVVIWSLLSIPLLCVVLYGVLFFIMPRGDSVEGHDRV